MREFYESQNYLMTIHCLKLKWIAFYDEFFYHEAGRGREFNKKLFKFLLEESTYLPDFQILNEEFCFTIDDISHEGVIEWEEQEKFAFVFQYQGELHEFPSLYPYYSDLVSAIKEARNFQIESSNSINESSVPKIDRTWR